jgi:hypothetical protein
MHGPEVHVGEGNMLFPTLQLSVTGVRKGQIRMVGMLMKIIPLSTVSDPAGYPGGNS